MPRPSARRPDPEPVLPPPARLPGGVPPTPLREEADPRFRGRGVTLAFVDSGFFPHPDLVQPRDRIAAYSDAGGEEVPLYSPIEAWHWHGTMTACVAESMARNALAAVMKAWRKKSGGATPCSRPYSATPALLTDRRLSKLSN